MPRRWSRKVSMRSKCRSTPRLAWQHRAPATILRTSREHRRRHRAAEADVDALAALGVRLVVTPDTARADPPRRRGRHGRGGGVLDAQRSLRRAGCRARACSSCSPPPATGRATSAHCAPCCPLFRFSPSEASPPTPCRPGLPPVAPVPASAANFTRQASPRSRRACAPAPSASPTKGPPLERRVRHAGRRQPLHARRRHRLGRAPAGIVLDRHPVERAVGACTRQRHDAAVEPARQTGLHGALRRPPAAAGVREGPVPGRTARRRTAATAAPGRHRTRTRRRHPQQRRRCDRDGNFVFGTRANLPMAHRSVRSTSTGAPRTARSRTAARGDRIRSASRPTAARCTTAIRRSRASSAAITIPPKRASPTRSSSWTSTTTARRTAPPSMPTVACGTRNGTGRAHRATRRAASWIATSPSRRAIRPAARSVARDSIAFTSPRHASTRTKPRCPAPEAGGVFALPLRHRRHRRGALSPDTGLPA